jgi:hypothetical protein
LSFRLDKKISINADYMSYLNSEDVSATGLTIGLGVKF